MARYPYIALLSGSGSRTKKVASSEGFALPADILQVLQPAVEQHGAQFIADQADHNERVCYVIACISKQSCRQAAPLSTVGTLAHMSHAWQELPLPAVNNVRLVRLHGICIH